MRNTLHLGGFKARLVPAALRATVDAWRKEGGAEQPPSSWVRGSWQRLFPDLAEWLGPVPNPISRAEVAALAATAANSEGAIRAFVASMIWGYGPVGYGPWRTVRVLENSHDSADRLAEVAQAVDVGGGMAGFRNIADRPLKYLGVAFGTKYLYFLSLAAAAKRGSTDGTMLAPVLDDVVRRWILANTGVRLRIDKWDPTTYATFLGLLDSWGAELQLRRDVVEELIFRSQISRDGSRFWGEGWAVSPADAEDPSAEALDALRQLRETLGALPGETSALDDAAPHLETVADIIERHR